MSVRGPLKMRPFLREMPWGGSALSRWGKAVPAGAKIGETWEVSDRLEGPSTVADGPQSGKTLAALLAEDPEGLCGKSRPARFPLLIKLLDANDWLSVQVHPDAEAARRFGARAEPKTECWTILEAKAGFFLYLGLAEGRTGEDLRRALDAKDPAKALRKVPVAAGDFLFVPAGTVHAIGPGIVLAEVQENSDTTYRLWDWGRVGKDGKPRALHLAEGLASIRTDPRAGKQAPKPPRKIPGGTLQPLIGSGPFTVERLSISGEATLEVGDTCLCLGAIDGSGEIRSGGLSVPFSRGDWIVVPHADRTCVIRPAGAALLLTARPASA